MTTECEAPQETARSCFECNFNYVGGLTCPSCNAASGEPLEVVPPAAAWVRRFKEVLGPDAVLWDSFEKAIVGYAYRCGMDPVALYDRRKCIESLIDGGLDEESAEEFFSFNVEGCFAGPGTPMIAIFECYE